VNIVNIMNGSAVLKPASLPELASKLVSAQSLTHSQEVQKQVSNTLLPVITFATLKAVQWDIGDITLPG
jgi:hypothetical protein